MEVTFTINQSKKRIKLSCDDRDLFDRIRLEYSVKNKDKRHNRYAQDRLYAITPLGSFKPGLFLDILYSLIKIDKNIKFNIGEGVMETCRPCSYEPEHLLDVQASGFEGRDYQDESVRQLLKYGRGVIKLATAAGKSFVIYKSIINLWKYHKKGKVLIIVPNIQLVKQLYNDILEYGCFEGEIEQFSSFSPDLDTRANIIISNRQWLDGHKDDLPDIDICIADEVHTLGGKTNKVSSYFESIPTNIKIGLTGTMPEDQISYWNVVGLCGKVLIERKAKDLQVDGYVAKLNIKVIKMDHGEPQPECRDPELTAMERAQRRFPLEWKYIEDSDWFNNYVIDLALKLPGNTFILFDHVEHGRHLETLCKQRIKDDRDVFFVDGTIDVDERYEMCKSMDKKGEGILIGNTKCVGTGVSIKSLHQVIFAFTSGNANVKIIQSIGRALRIREDKDSATLYDLFHNFRYSAKHFKQRLKLYKQEYEVESWEVIEENRKDLQ